MFSDQTALMVTIEKEINSKFKSSIHKALVNCIFTGNMIQHIHENGLRAYDLSFQQFNILRILKGAKKKVTMNYLKVGLNTENGLLSWNLKPIVLFPDL